MDADLKPGRYCQHGAVVPGPLQYGYAAGQMMKGATENAIAAAIDWCDICTGVNRTVTQPTEKAP